MDKLFTKILVQPGPKSVFRFMEVSAVEAARRRGCPFYVYITVYQFSLKQAPLKNRPHPDMASSKAYFSSPLCCS